MISGGMGCSPGFASFTASTSTRFAFLLSEGYTILTSDTKNPDVAAEYQSYADLNLSGHTHGGQVWPLGIFNEYWSSNDYNYGLRTYGEMTSIVTSGIAGWGYSIRTQKTCEYLIIHIKAAQ